MRTSIYKSTYKVRCIVVIPGTSNLWISVSCITVYRRMIYTRQYGTYATDQDIIKYSYLCKIQYIINYEKMCNLYFFSCHPVKLKSKSNKQMFKSSIKASKMSKGTVNDDRPRQTIAAGIRLQNNVKYKYIFYKCINA